MVARLVGGPKASGRCPHRIDLRRANRGGDEESPHSSGIESSLPTVTPGLALIRPSTLASRSTARPGILYMPSIAGRRHGESPDRNLRNKANFPSHHARLRPEFPLESTKRKSEPPIAVYAEIRRFYLHENRLPENSMETQLTPTNRIFVKKKKPWRPVAATRARIRSESDQI